MTNACFLVLALNETEKTQTLHALQVADPCYSIDKAHERPTSYARSCCAFLDRDTK